MINFSMSRNTIVVKLCNANLHTKRHQWFYERNEGTNKFFVTVNHLPLPVSTIVPVVSVLVIPTVISPFAEHLQPKRNKKTISLFLTNSAFLLRGCFSL